MKTTCSEEATSVMVHGLYKDSEISLPEVQQATE